MMYFIGGFLSLVTAGMFIFVIWLCRDSSNSLISLPNGGAIRVNLIQAVMPQEGVSVEEYSVVVVWKSATYNSVQTTVQTNMNKQSAMDLAAGLIAEIKQRT